MQQTLEKLQQKTEELLVNLSINNNCTIIVDKVVNQYSRYL